MPRIEIFKTGRHTDMHGQKVEFSEEMVKAIAEGYDPKLHEAPIVVGHPKDNGPAFGWIGQVEYADGSLDAEPSQLDPAFAESVRAGHYKKVSASFYGPNSAANPKPGQFYLRHVGFLGAQPPAIKGLRGIDTASFSEEDDQIVTLEFHEKDLSFGELEPRTVANIFGRLRDFFIEKWGLDEADKALPSYEVDWLKERANQPSQPDNTATSSFSEEDGVPTTPEKETSNMSKKDDQGADKVDFAEREAAIDAREKKLKDDQLAFAETKRKAEAETFINGLVGKGSVLPADKDSLVNFMAKLDDKDTLSFSEGAEEQSRHGFMVSFLEGLPKRVDFSEHSGDDGANVEPLTDPNAIAKEALAYQEEMKGKGQTVSIDVAVRHVSRQSQA